MCLFLTFKGLPFGSVKELLSEGKNRCRSLTEDYTWATQASPWAPASRGERCWQFEALWSLDTGITTRLSTAPESGPLRTAAALFCLQQRTRGSERRLRCLVVSGLPMVFWVGFTILTAVGPPYPWVLHLQIQPSVDWTYLKKHVLLLQTGTNRPTEHEQTFLVIIPSTISLMTIYIALPLY